MRPCPRAREAVSPREAIVAEHGQVWEIRCSKDRVSAHCKTEGFQGGRRIVLHFYRVISGLGGGGQSAYRGSGPQSAMDACALMGSRTSAEHKM